MKSIVEEIFYGNLRPNDGINKYAEKEVQEMLIAEETGGGPIRGTTGAVRRIINTAKRLRRA